MLKEKDAETRGAEGRVAEERELAEVHKQEADALAAIRQRAARAKNGGEGPVVGGDVGGKRLAARARDGTLGE